MQLNLPVTREHPARVARAPPTLRPGTSRTVPLLCCTAQVPRSSDAGTHRSRTKSHEPSQSHDYSHIRRPCSPARHFQRPTPHFTAAAMAAVRRRAVDQLGAGRVMWPVSHPSADSRISHFLAHHQVGSALIGAHTVDTRYFASILS